MVGGVVVAEGEAVETGMMMEDGGGVKGRWVVVGMAVVMVVGMAVGMVVVMRAGGGGGEEVMVVVVKGVEAARQVVAKVENRRLQHSTALGAI